MFRSSKIPLCLALSAAACLSLSCKNRNFNQSETQHTPKVPVYSANPVQWITLTPEEFRQHTGLSQREFLPDSHRMVQRLQFWVDQIDAWTRSVSKIDMTEVPKPIVQVMMNKQVNAFVSGVPTSYYQFPIINGGDDATHYQALVFMPQTLEMRAMNIGFVGVSRDRDDFGKFFAHIQSQMDEKSRAECNIRYENIGKYTDGSKSVLVDGPCVASLKGDATKLVAFATGNYVTVLSGLLQKFSEEEVVAVVAHELGHYYRSHVTATRNRVEYFYENGLDNPARKPAETKNPELLALGKELKQLANTTFLRSSPSLVYNRELMVNLLYKDPEKEVGMWGRMFGSDGPVIDILKSKCGGDRECKTLCDSAAQTAYGKDFQKLLFRLDPPTTDVEKALYSDVEKKLTACSAKVKLTRSQKDQDLILKNLGKDFLALIGKINHPTFATALEALEFASREGNKLNDRWVAKLREAENKRLGYYTSEQEADEFSVEALAALNLPLQAAIDLYVSFIKSNEDPAAMTKEECKQALANNWRDQNGKPMMIPIGRWEDTHHSACYRAFNVSREIKAHNFAVAPQKKATPPGPAWNQLVNEMNGNYSYPTADENSESSFNLQRFCRSGMARCM